MPAKRPPGLDYTLRTATSRTVFKGAGPASHPEGIRLLFVALPDALARRKVLDALEKAHAKLLASEAGPELSGKQRADLAATLASQVHPGSALPSRKVGAGECAASGVGHHYGPHGPNGAAQCEWCGEAAQ